MTARRERWCWCVHSRGPPCAGMIQIRFDGRSFDQLPLSPAHRTPVFGVEHTRPLPLFFAKQEDGWAELLSGQVRHQECARHSSLTAVPVLQTSAGCGRAPPARHSRAHHRWHAIAGSHRRPPRARRNPCTTAESRLLTAPTRRGRQVRCREAAPAGVVRGPGRFAAAGDSRAARGPAVALVGSSIPRALGRVRSPGACHTAMELIPGTASAARGRRSLDSSRSARVRIRAELARQRRGCTPSGGRHFGSRDGGCVPRHCAHGSSPGRQAPQSAVRGRAVAQSCSRAAVEGRKRIGSGVAHAAATSAHRHPCATAGADWRSWPP